MNKKLFTQIKNEWRSNLWLVTELLLVSVVLWYIVDYMYVQTSIYNEPRGFDISHCYLVQMGRLTDKSPDFIPNQTDEEKRQDIKELLSRLQHRPDIEAAGLGQNSYPYNGSNSSACIESSFIVWFSIHKTKIEHFKKSIIRFPHIRSNSRHSG